MFITKLDILNDSKCLSQNLGDLLNDWKFLSQNLGNILNDCKCLNECSCLSQSLGNILNDWKCLPQDLGNILNDCTCWSQSLGNILNYCRCLSWSLRQCFKMTVNVYHKLLCAGLRNAYTSLASPYKYSRSTPQGNNSGTVLKVVTYPVQLLAHVVTGHGQFYPGPKPHQQILFHRSISWAECSFPVALWIPVKNEYNHVYMFVYVWFVFWFTGVLMCSDFKSVLGTCYGSWGTVIVFWFTRILCSRFTVVLECFDSRLH